MISLTERWKDRTPEEIAKFLKLPNIARTVESEIEAQCLSAYCRSYGDVLDVKMSEDTRDRFQTFWEMVEAIEAGTLSEFTLERTGKGLEGERSSDEILAEMEVINRSGGDDLFPAVLLNVFPKFLKRFADIDKYFEGGLTEAEFPGLEAAVEAEFKRLEVEEGDED
jgi:hypothetical protein